MMLEDACAIISHCCRMSQLFLENVCFNSESAYETWICSVITFYKFVRNDVKILIQLINNNNGVVFPLMISKSVNQIKTDDIIETEVSDGKYKAKIIKTN